MEPIGKERTEWHGVLRSKNRTRVTARRGLVGEGVERLRGQKCNRAHNYDVFRLDIPLSGE